MASMVDYAMSTILITGATDGIGLALARLQAERGDRLVLVGRRALADLPERVRALTDRHPYCRADLSRPDAARIVCDFLGAHRITALDRLVLNAAEGYFGDIGDQSPDAIRRMVDLNLTGPIALTHTLAPLLVAARGRVTFVSSAVSSLPSPRYAVYSATKAALEGFTRSLRIEARGRFEVQVVRPGATRTGLHEKMGLPPSVMDWTKFPSAEETAGPLARALDTRPRTVTLGAANMVMYGVGRIAPGVLEWAMRLTGRRRARSETPDRSAAGHPSTELRSGAGPRCVITGAADGIGRALALEFARAGYEIVGIDRDEARAARTQADVEAAGGTASFLRADLSDAEDVERTVTALSEGPPVGVLVHNAGISAVGRFEDHPLANQRDVLRLNLLAPLLLTAGLLRHGALAEAPRVVCLASLSCFTGYPGAAVYAASKDGLASYARSLSVALGPEARVLTVYPGPVRTLHAERYSPDNARADRRMPPEALAERIVRAVLRGDRGTLVPGAANRAAALTGHLFPGAMESVMKRVILDKLDQAEAVQG